MRLRARAGGQRFRPGQFAWLKLAQEPFALAEHFFSYASSCLGPGQPWFTIKAYAGFTRRVPELPVGTRLLIDGPRSSYAPRRQAGSYVLIVGGIGVTPAMNIPSISGRPR